MHPLIVATLLAAVAEPPGAAPPPATTQDERKELEEQIARDLGAPAPAGGPAPSPATPEGARAQPAPPPTAGAQGQVGGNPFARLMLLPDISAIGDAALAWNRLDVETLSPRSDPFAPANDLHPVLQELELGLQAVVDPYARADVFLAFTPGGAAVEEAYLTTLSLPAGLQLRAGQMYAPFGRMNAQHSHVWEFVDRPLALARLVGVDALKGPGLVVSWLAPVPWFVELTVAYQSLTPGFQTTSHDGGVARLGQFFDVGSSAALGVGVSGGLMGAAGDGQRELLGTDVYLRYRPPDSRSYLALQGELVVRRLTGSGDSSVVAGGDLTQVEPPGTEWGGYVHALVRDGPYVAYGVRYERAPGVGGGPENRVSAIASWLPSEFQRVRFQVSYDRLPGGTDGLEALLQLEFAIGAHGAHPF